MQLGFNTNFRHRGVLFHVQTEDSGLGNPHVITHLFHGGNILASEKSTYADKLGSGQLEQEIRILMETQHRAMLRKLTTGACDTVIQQRLGAGIFRDASDTEADFVAPEPELQPGDEGLSPPTAPTAVEGLPAAPAAEGPGAASPAAAPPVQAPARRLGDGVVSQKPLDEVVLDFLVENARKRKRRAKP